jgi:hypothetical protein
MKVRFRSLARLAYAAVGLALTATIAFPGLAQEVLAAQQIGTRSIEISNSLVSATGVSYLVTFTTSSASSGDESLVIDFCQDSPIIAATCTTTHGLTFSSPTITGSTLPAGWAYDTSSGSTIKLKGTSTALAASTSYHFTITGVNNPTGTIATSGLAGSFYGRIYTYGDNTYGGGVGTAYSSATSIGTDDDYGGFALSTTSQIDVTATVQETLTFCVSGTTITGTCTGGLSAPDVTIGTGSPPVLDTAGESAPAYTQLTTNALTGASVTMKASNACTNGGMSVAPPDVSGGCSEIAGTGSSPAALTSGTWGMCVLPGSGVTPDATYLDGSVNNCSTTYSGTTQYGMNGANVTGTYGDAIYGTSGAVDAISSTLNFAAKAANTTPAGVYQANETLIATGTF